MVMRELRRGMRAGWKTVLLPLVLFLVGGPGGCKPRVSSDVAPVPEGGLARLETPPAGKLYHGVYPGGASGEEDDITRQGVGSYEKAVGKRAAWVCFSHNWWKGTEFPRETADWVRSLGAVPFIRLMIREENGSARGRFSVEAILAGRLDGALRRWAAAARGFATPLIVEYGTECNGFWFPWNGSHLGDGKRDGFGDKGKPDGPERFAAAYRRVVTLMRSEGAHNITWLFHVDAQDDPEEPWNRLENYYPGDEYVDWIGLSAYGTQKPSDDQALSFRQQVDQAYARVGALAGSKPVIVAEFGCASGSPAADQAEWAAAALSDLLGLRWPRVIGFSWWNERWQNDGNPAHDSRMRVEDSPKLAAAFRGKLEAAGARILERPIVASARP
jgi:hypothetical protein